MALLLLSIQLCALVGFIEACKSIDENFFAWCPGSSKLEKRNRIHRLWRAGRFTSWKLLCRDQSQMVPLRLLRHAKCQFLTTVTVIEPEWPQGLGTSGRRDGRERSPTSTTAVEPASGVLPQVYVKIEAFSAFFIRIHIQFLVLF